MRGFGRACKTAAARRKSEAVVIFNNCVGIQAVTNATALGELLRTDGGNASVVPVPKAAERTLFDAVQAD